MNKNLDRLKSGWFPYPDAHPIYWLLADLIVLKSIIIMWIKTKVTR